MTSTQRPTVRLTKIKQWFLPVDAESYKVFAAAGIPLNRVHEDMMPTVKLLTKSHKIRLESVDFQEAIMKPYIDKLSLLWRKKSNRTSTITASVLKFETTHRDGYDAAKAALPKLELTLRRFFTRWGYSATFDISESRGKVKMHVTYRHDSSRSPVISLVEDKELLPEIKLELGFIRLSLTPGERDVEVKVAQKHGTLWNTISTTTALYDQFSDVRPMIAALMGIVNKDIYNSENKSK